MTSSVPPEFVATSKEQAQWMLHRLAPGRGICDIGIAFKVSEQLRWWPLQEALNHVLRRHPALRATMWMSGVQLRKRILGSEDCAFPLETHAAQEKLDDQITRLVATPFDLDQRPLVRAHLIMLPKGSVVCVVLHHLVADSITTQVVMRELVALYDAFAQGASVPDELSSTAAFHVEDEAEQGALAYWTDHLDGVDASGLAIAGARPAPTRPTFAGIG